MGNVEVHALRLVDVALAHACCPHGPALVDVVGILVQPQGLQREVGRHAGHEPALLLLQEEELHDGVDTGGGAGDDAGAAGGGHCEQP